MAGYPTHSCACLTVHTPFGERFTENSGNSDLSFDKDGVTVTDSGRRPIQVSAIQLEDEHRLRTAHTTLRIRSVVDLFSRDLCGDGGRVLLNTSPLS